MGQIFGPSSVCWMGYDITKPKICFHGPSHSAVGLIKNHLECLLFLACLKLKALHFNNVVKQCTCVLCFCVSSSKGLAKTDNLRCWRHQYGHRSWGVAWIMILLALHRMGHPTFWPQPKSALFNLFISIFVHKWPSSQYISYEYSHKLSNATTQLNFFSCPLMYGINGKQNCKYM